MIKFIELHACSVRFEGLTPSNRARTAISTHKNSTQDTVKALVSSKLAMALELEQAGGMVEPLLCRAYIGKLLILFGCTLSKQVSVSQVKLKSTCIRLTLAP